VDGGFSDRPARLIRTRSAASRTARFVFRECGFVDFRTQLLIAWHRGHITREELADLDKAYEEIAKMLSGLIGHLEQEGRKHRR
jgi:hypothetical protein